MIDAPESDGRPSAEGSPVLRPLHRLGVALLVGALAMVLVVLSTGLMTGRPVGAADNGDGARLFCGAGLVPDTPTGQSNWTGGVVLDFIAGSEPCPDPVPSSAGALLNIAVGDADGSWQLTELGWLYALTVAAITVVAVWAATAGGLVRGLVLVPALVPLADPDFSRFFLSTYGEPAGLVGTYALCMGAGAVSVTAPGHRGERGMALLLAAAGGLLATTAKTAYAPVLGAAVLVCLVTRIAVPGRRRYWSHLGGLALAAALIAASLAPLASAHQWQTRNYAVVNTHNVVFTLVLPAVGPEAATRLGLPPRAYSRAGQAYYPDGSAGIPGAEVIEADPDAVRIAAWRILAENPGTVLQALGIALQSTSGRDLAYLPEAPWTPDTPPTGAAAPVGPQAATSASLHAWLDGMSMPWWPSVLAAVGIALGAASHRIRAPLARGLGRLSGLSAVTAVGLAMVAVLGDGYFEIAKHTWLSAYLLDVTLWAAIGAVIVVVLPFLRRERRRPPAGPDIR